MPKDAIDLGDSPEDAAERSENFDSAFDADLQAQAGVKPGEAGGAPAGVAPPANDDPKKPEEAPAATDPKKPEEDPDKKGALAETETDLLVNPKPDEVVTDDPKKPDEKKTVAKTPEEEAKELEAIDIEALQPPADIAPKNLGNWNTVRKLAAHFKKKFDEVFPLVEKVKELEGRKPEIPEAMTKELEDHRNFRKLFDTENSPEFKKEFDDHITSIDETILGIFKKEGMPEKDIEAIKKAGIGNVSSKFWEEHIFNKLGFIDNERIKKGLAARADLVDNRAKRVQEFVGKREEFLKTEQERKDAEFGDYDKKVQEHAKKLAGGVDWAQPKEIPANATAEQKKQIEEHNASVATWAEHFKEALYPTTPEARAEIAAAAVASVKLAGDVKALQAQRKVDLENIKKLEDQLAKLKGASVLPGELKKPSKEAEKPDNVLDLSNDDAFERGMEAAAQE